MIDRQTVHSEEPTARRGRPRNESCSAEILDAVLAIVAEVGIAGLTMDAVAQRAGVGKATIYRRWSSKESMTLDAWASCVTTPPVPDTGNLVDDLRQVLAPSELLSTNADLQRVYPQLIAAARVNPEFAATYREFIAHRRAPLRTVLQRALARGEIRADADLEVVQDLLVAPLTYRWVISDAPIDEAFVDGIIAVVTSGVAPPA